MKRNREQAMLFLVGRAWIGDPEARDLLELFFPNPAEMKSAEAENTRFQDLSR